MTRLPGWFARTLTWDRGTELARHARITAETGISVYFADPHAPWQRGSNENINGLLREYLPKGTDLSPYTAAQLQHIENELNDRPRKRFGWHTPREELDRLLTENQTVATTPEYALPRLPHPVEAQEGHQQAPRLHLHRPAPDPVAEGEDPCPDPQDITAGPPTSVLTSLNQAMHGWANYFRHAVAQEDLQHAG